MSRIYANKENREYLRQTLGDRGVEIFDYFKDHGFDYMGFYTGFIITRNGKYLKDPPHGYIIFPKGMRDPHASGCFGYMYRVQWDVDLDGNEDFFLYTSFAPQDEMEPKYLLGKLGDKELQLLVSERAKDMFKTWKKKPTAEMIRQSVNI